MSRHTTYTCGNHTYPVGLHRCRARACTGMASARWPRSAQVGHVTIVAPNAAAAHRSLAAIDARAEALLSATLVATPGAPRRGIFWVVVFRVPIILRPAYENSMSWRCLCKAGSACMCVASLPYSSFWDLAAQV